MSDLNERLRILDLIEKGEISADEGVRLLQELPADDSTDTSADLPASLPSGQTSSPEKPVEPIMMPGAPKPPVSPEVEDDAGQEKFSTVEPAVAVQDPADTASRTQPSKIPPEMLKWQRWWMIPLWFGVGITILGGLLMYSVLKGSGVGFWLLCSSLPFLLGVLVIGVAWWSRTARWLHIRIDQKPGHKPQHIALSFPIPIHVAGWFLRRFGNRIPNLKNTSLDEIIVALGDSTSPDTPLFIDVDEGEDGERVRVYIG